MKVTITQGIRCVHDGQVYLGGQTADVPETVAHLWLGCGWCVSESHPPDQTRLASRQPRKSRRTPIVYARPGGK